MSKERSQIFYAGELRTHADLEVVVKILILMAEMQ